MYLKWLWPSVFPAKNWPQKACPEFETTMTRFHFFCLFLQFSILSSSFSLEVQEDLVNLVTICKGRNHKVSHQWRYIIAFQLFIKKKNLHYTRQLSTDQILLFAMTFPFSGPVIPTKDILQGELEPEEDVDQSDGSLRGRGRQPPRPHWWGDPTLGRCNHPKCDWPTSDWGRRVWFWEQQCHIASSLSRCLVKIKSILSLLILADVDQLTRSIDRDLLATMRNLFGWESFPLFVRENVFAGQAREQDRCGWGVWPSSADILPRYWAWSRTPLAKCRWARDLSHLFFSDFSQATHISTSSSLHLSTTSYSHTSTRWLSSTLTSSSGGHQAAETSCDFMAMLSFLLPHHSEPVIRWVTSSWSGWEWLRCRSCSPCSMVTSWLASSATSPPITHSSPPGPAHLARQGY